MRTKLIRFMPEFLFALNLALVAKLEGNQRPNRVFSWLDRYEFPLQLKINQALHLFPHHWGGSIGAFMLLSLALALCVFILLKILAISSTTERFLNRAAGLISLLAWPVAWLIVTFIDPAYAKVSTLAAVVAFECVLTGVAAILFGMGIWRISPIPGVVLVIAHFAFAYWIVFGGLFVWRNPITILFPLVGIASTVFWARYLRQTKLSATVDA